MIKRIFNRKRNRLKDYDYSTNNYYYVTICSKNRDECFGVIKNGLIKLNKYGKIVKKQWLWLVKQYRYIKLDEYIVMPNHFHGILIINNENVVGTGRDPKNVGTGRDLSLQYKIKSLSELIGAFKTTSSKLIHENGLADFAWQRSFYDNIIRSDKALLKIREYIFNNPLNWDLDRNNLENIK